VVWQLPKKVLADCIFLKEVFPGEVHKVQCRLMKDFQVVVHFSGASVTVSFFKKGIFIRFAGLCKELINYFFSRRCFLVEPGRIDFRHMHFVLKCTGFSDLLFLLYSCYMNNPGGSIVIKGNP